MLAIFFPIITIWELTVAMKTRVLIRYGPKLMQHFPKPMMPQMKFDYNLPSSLRDIHVLKSGWTDGHMNVLTKRFKSGIRTQQSKKYPTSLHGINLILSLLAHFICK